jgi:hypothetical protein
VDATPAVEEPTPEVEAAPEVEPEAAPEVEAAEVAPAAPEVAPAAQETAPAATAAVEGLCPVCFPYGAPAGAVTVGCEHGSWTVPLS